MPRIMNDHETNLMNQLDHCKDFCFENKVDIKEELYLWSYNKERPNMGNGGMTPAQKLRMAA